MQNSLERLLDGMAAALVEVVAPGLGDDPYARGQALACAELLRNLAPRVEWRCGDLAEVVRRARALLAQADAVAPPGEDALRPARALLAQPDPDPADNAALVEARRRHLAALAAVQGWLARGGGGEAAALRAEVRAFAAWHLRTELERLRPVR
jgi:hypothetical protein